MITVRSPTGFSVQYNDARYAVRHDAGYTDLYKEKERQGWVAQVPNDWLVEVERPCRVYDAAHNPQDLAEEFLKAVRERRIGGYTLVEIKSALRLFNAVKRRWNK